MDDIPAFGQLLVFFGLKINGGRAIAGPKTYAVTSAMRPERKPIDAITAIEG